MNTEQTVNNHEMLSALADGQLRGAAFVQAVESVRHDEDAQATWHCYHLIGDVLRSGELAQCRGDNAFLARLQTRLKQEPGFARPLTADAPGVELLATQAAVQRVTGEVTPQAVALPVAANAASFRWKMVAGFASMAAVVAIGWNLVGASGGMSPLSQQIALVSVPTPSASGSPVQPVQLVGAIVSAPVTQTVAQANGEPQQIMIRDRRLDELMAAHKQFGGTSALQMPAGFLRNATFEVPAR